MKELDRQSGEKPSSARPGSVGNVYGSDSPVYGDYAPNKHASLHDDTGGASRFFKTFPPDNDVGFRYVPKPSRAERNQARIEDTEGF